ncbi:cytochrome P450 3A41 [Caerostris darwini]|uniref:Cytochrome P450 3A41 n=1 Tax=Caerostris darwini TaxID=1538125 RepID=A0AAV4UB78_9ARAC|nr:cytochrome P450 3A41 [Caerostris darwini]
MFIKNKGDIPPLKITKVLEVLIKQRRNNPGMKKPDLLQWLIEARASDDDLGTKDSYENGTTSSESSKFQRRRRTLNDTEIISNALVVFLAGFETTSSALAFVFHFLKKYPEQQRKFKKK